MYDYDKVGWFCLLTVSLEKQNSENLISIIPFLPITMVHYCSRKQGRGLANV